MKNEEGFLSIMDAFFAILLLIMAFLVLNSFLFIPFDSYSSNSLDSKNSQDIMTSLSTKVNYNDTTFLEEITNILEENDNSEKSIKIVSKMIENKILIDKNFVFKENSPINKVLYSKGDYFNSENFTVASRSCGNYSYSLIIYE